MTQEDKLNNIAIKMARATSNFSDDLMRTVFKVEKYERKITYDQMFSALRKVNGATLLDSYYYLAPIWLWKKIIEADWTNERQYIKDRYDCDNFAFSFQARADEKFGLNSCPPLYCKYYSEQGVFVDYHYINVIVDDILDIYLLEPMNDCLVKYNKEGKISIGGKGIYEPIRGSVVF